MSVKQSFCFPLFGDDEKLPSTELFKSAKEIGYEAAEFWFRESLGDYGSVFESARSSGLRICSMCGHTSHEEGLNDPENHERIESELRDSIDVAVQFDIPGVICLSGNRRLGIDDYEGLIHTARGLKRIAPYAEEKNIDLNLELLNSRIDHPLYMADRTTWGAALCEIADSPRVKLLYDIYHMQIMEGDVIRSLERYASIIGHIHTAGNPGRRDFDDTQELNYAGICSTIDRSGYKGYVGHEFRPKGDIVESLEAAFRRCSGDGIRLPS